MKKVKCSFCGSSMNCPEKMLKAKKHMCAKCADMISFGFTEEEVKSILKLGINKKLFKKSDKIAENLLDLTFWGFWHRTLKVGLDKFNEEQLAKEFYLHGASSAFGLLVSLGFEPELLDEIDCVIDESKKSLSCRKMMKDFKEKIKELEK